MHPLLSHERSFHVFTTWTAFRRMKSIYYCQQAGVQEYVWTRSKGGGGDWKNEIGPHACHMSFCEMLLCVEKRGWNEVRGPPWSTYPTK